MENILITGANRGIGFGIVKYLISNYSNVKLIFAGYRNANKSEALLQLAKQHPNVIFAVQLDTSDNASIGNAKLEVEHILGNDLGLNCLINNAGISKNLKFKDIDEANMIDTFRQNVVGVCQVTKAFLPLVQRSITDKRIALQASVINMSTIISSHAVAATLPYVAYDYQCSKAALNMYTVCLATDLIKSNVFIAAIHPGWVQTDMGGDKAPMNILEAAENIIDCITGMKDEHYGKLIDATSGSRCTIIPF